ncbi:unnamed protein product [Thlaspi arvense]|uniref:Uncharacterized protein n=1 Tax=Thlaspi arvense TaxID=13288 RepID=A0AAU9RXA1_THLAR|nr:unnamed protein product [Thlaspi arvense]
MKYELVFIPFPVSGHLRSAVEMAKLLVDQANHLSISVIILPFLSGRDDVGASDLSDASNERLRYELISDEDQQNAEPAGLDMHINNQVPKVRRAVAKLVEHKSTRLAGFVLDMFCTSMIDVANEFGVPSYMFYTSSAGALRLRLYFQQLDDENEFNFSESDLDDSEAELVIPGLTCPYPVKCLPRNLSSKEWFLIFVNQSRRFREMNGILINTVAELEPYPLESLSTGFHPVYLVEPLLHLENQVDDSKEEKQTEILSWLDEQPAKSVVFLCFGSLGSFSEGQAREFAVALEQSRHRFLWSLRS